MEYLFDKDGIQLKKESSNNYDLTFTLENDNIYLEKIVDFNLFKLIFKLNEDVCEDFQIEYKSNDEAIMTILFKHLFEDLGISQKYFYCSVKKTLHKNRIQFFIEKYSNLYSNSNDHLYIDDSVESITIKQIICDCIISTPHIIELKINIEIDDNCFIPKFIEKMVSVILGKILKRTKAFIKTQKIV
jgi:hypothetical protein